MPPKMKFVEGERVLCFHGPLLYEAKCVKWEVKEKTNRYFIHYNGWNKNWDEWVPESRVLKFNEAGLQKQRELQKAHISSKKTKVNKKQEKERAPTPVEAKQKQPKLPSFGEAASSCSSTPVTEQKRKRARSDPTVESEAAFQAKIEVKVKIPDDLKLWLVDDWDLIAKQKKLINLPAKKPVEQILEDYVKFKTSKGNNNKDAVALVTQGIREYFNVTLGTQLLYKFERPQYAEILENHPDSPMSTIYGSVHLLRLFVKIGGMLAYTSLDEKSIQLLLTHFHDFLRYLQKNAYALLSSGDYYLAPPEYHRKVV